MQRRRPSDRNRSHISTVLVLLCLAVAAPAASLDIEDRQSPPPVAQCRALVSLGDSGGVHLDDLDEQRWRRLGGLQGGMWWVTPGTHSVRAVYRSSARVRSGDSEYSSETRGEGAVALSVEPRREYAIRGTLEKQTIAFDVAEVTQDWKPVANPAAEDPLLARRATARVHVLRKEIQAVGEIETIQVYFFCDSVPLARTICYGNSALSFVLPAGRHCFAASKKEELKSDYCRKHGLTLDLLPDQDIFLQLKLGATMFSKQKVQLIDEAVGRAEMKEAHYLTLDRVHPRFRSPDPCNSAKPAQSREDASE